MTGYNNSKYLANSINSALSQDYKNFNIIYRDDCSTDSSQEILKDFLNNQKIDIIFNQKRLGKLANIYNACNAIPENTIILELDADDYLKDEFVLDRFNKLYQKTGCLIAHANYKNNPEDLAIKLNMQKFSNKTPWLIKQLRTYRSYKWIYSGLRSYNVNLFKKIKKEDLFYEQDFLQYFHDAAMFYPMLEMAGNKVEYIAEELLIRNIDSPINDFKKLPKDINSIKLKVLNSKRYEKLY